MNYFGMKLLDGTNAPGTNKRLTTLRSRYEWLAALPNCTQQEILRDLDKAFSNFFKRVKRGETPGYPRGKRRGDLPRLYFPKTSLSIVEIDGNKYLKLPKLPLIRIQWDREALERLDDSIISGSVVYEHGHWFLCLLVKKTIDVIMRDLPPVGINRGIVHTVALSDGIGYSIDTQKLKDIEQRKVVLQKRLARKVGSKKGQPKSGHWLRQKHQIDKIDAYMSGIRSNFNHQTSRDIVSKYGDISIEDYDIKSMTKSAKGTVEQPGELVQVKATFNQAQLRNAWGALGTMLTYKSSRLGHEVTKKGVSFITQECSECGHTDPGNVNERTRTFTCLKCKFIIDIDTNAALNVLHR
jgi:putative transposase